ncbi:hypothetical protein QBC32DRAFT_309773 [Pseudoneurospora amorphoporcata]|uniref:Uncharacterized protein n=1 Tax=Pseudoneurospora amorphoporcata TaxID=241081 RepID=A0AAN6SK98_9PEZI|nr:hypothetical protein QBC32DRAFT_309773 [Pseudoneurospora amorphoporcata]
MVRQHNPTGPYELNIMIYTTNVPKDFNLAAKWWLPSPAPSSTDYHPPPLPQQTRVPHQDKKELPRLLKTVPRDTETRKPKTTGLSAQYTYITHKPWAVIASVLDDDLGKGEDESEKEHPMDSLNITDMKKKKKKKPGLTLKSRTSTILNKADLVKHLQTRNGTKLDEEPDLAQEELRNDMSTMTDTKLEGQGRYLPLFLHEYHLPIFIHEYLLVAIYLTLIIGGLSRLLEVFLPVFIR